MALALFLLPSAAFALEVKNGDLALPKKPKHGAPIAPDGFRVEGKAKRVTRFEAAPPFGGALALSREGRLVYEVTLPKPPKPDKVDPTRWYAVASVDVVGLVSDTRAGLELSAKVKGKRAVLGAGSLWPETKAPRGGTTTAKAELAGRLWVKIPSKRLSSVGEATIEVVLSTTGKGKVVIDNVRFDLFHDEPPRALVGKPNGKNGPDLLASGMLGFLALSEHMGTAFSLLDIREGGPAEKAGLKRSDLVVAVEGVPLAPGSLAAGEAWFREGHEAVLGRAIQAALANSGKHITLTVLRDRGTKDLKLKLPIAGGFAETFPFGDPVAETMRKDITTWIVEHQKPNGFWPHNREVNSCLAGLALLGTRDKRHKKALRKLTDALLAANPTAADATGFSYWPIAFQGIFFCEYYLATGDKRVLAWIDDAITWLPSTTHESKWGMQAFGHSPKGLPYGKKALMAPCAHLLLFEALALRCGVKSKVWQHIKPYVLHSWSDPKTKKGHGGMGYNGSYKDKAEFWSRSGLTALALHLREDRKDMRTALTRFMAGRHAWMLNSHAYGEPGGALGLVSLYAVHPKGFAEVMPQWRWRFLNAWQPDFGLRYSSAHMGAPYMGEEGIMNPAYGMLLAIMNQGLVMAGGEAERWLTR